MAEVNVQSFLFTSSGLLSAATGPLNSSLIKVPSASGGLTDQPVQNKKIRLMGIKVVKTGAAGSVEVFDSASATVAPKDSIYLSDANENMTNWGYNSKSGDIFVAINGGFKVYLYVDINS